MLARRRQGAAARRGGDAATAAAGIASSSGSSSSSTTLVDGARGNVDVVVQELLSAFAPYALPSLASHDDDDKDEALRLATTASSATTAALAAAAMPSTSSASAAAERGVVVATTPAMVTSGGGDDDDDRSALFVERSGSDAYEDVPLTQAVLLVYLNPGSDPPDCVRVSPCARMECWLDGPTAPQASQQGALAARVLGLPPAAPTHTQRLHGRQSESDVVAEALERQYRAVLRVADNMAVVRVADAAVDVARSALVKARRMAARAGRVLVHYNGHGMPRATALGEVWMLDADKTHYVPLNLIEAAELVGAPVLFVLDCNAAAAVLQRWLRDRVPQRRPHDVFICACSAGETLPQHPALPADVLTACLTTPLAMALEWYIAFAPRAVLLPQLTPAMVRGLPGDVADRRTPLGELTAILHAVTDTIAWCTMRPAQFHYLFRQSAALKTLFRNAVLADRLLREAGCTPRTYPPLSEACHVHAMWAAWDCALEKALSTLPRLLAALATKNNSSSNSSNSSNNNNSSNSTLRDLYEGTGFFDEQLTAFAVWLHSGDTTQLPVQLPCVLLALTQTTHRVRAFTLLVRYLDTGGRVAGKRAVLCGLVPYLSRLMAKAPEVFLLSAVLWMQVVRADAAAGCREMQAMQCEKYLVRLLRLDAAGVHVRTVGYGERVHTATTTTATAATNNNNSSHQHSVSPVFLSPCASPPPPPSSQPATWQQQQPQQQTTTTAPQQPLQPPLLHRPAVLASHAVLQQHGDFVYYLLPDVDVARCKSMACYVLCQFMQRGERACVLCWNNHLLNAAFPCLSAPQAELRSWACLTLATLSTHLRHAHEYLSRACTTRLDLLTRLLHDGSPVVRSSCVTLLASIVGARLDYLPPPPPAPREAQPPSSRAGAARHVNVHVAGGDDNEGAAAAHDHDDDEQQQHQQQQLRRVHMEKTMLIRLRAHVHDASMDVREELVHFACRVLYAYGSLLTPDDDDNDNNNNDNNDDNDNAAVTTSAHDDGHALHDVLSGVTRTRVMDFVARTWRHTPPATSLWALEESDVTVRSQLHAARPTVSARFRDAVVFDTAFLACDDAPPPPLPLQQKQQQQQPHAALHATTTTALDRRRIGAAALRVVHGLLHDAARMLQLLYHNCDAVNVRNALRELARATAAPTYTCASSSSSSGRGYDGDHHYMTASVAPTHVSGRSSSGNNNSHVSSAAPPPPRSRRLATEALRSMSRVASSESTTASSSLTAAAATQQTRAAAATAAAVVGNSGQTTLSPIRLSPQAPLPPRDVDDATTTAAMLTSSSSAATAISTSSFFASEADRARATWNADMMRRLVLDLRDRRLVPRATTQLGTAPRTTMTAATTTTAGAATVTAARDASVRNGSHSLSKHSSYHNVYADDDCGLDNDDNGSRVDASVAAAALVYTRHPVLPSVVPCSSVVCTAFRALEPAAVVVTRDQRFHYVAYGDGYTRQRRLHSFTVPLRDAVQDVRLVNDLAEQPGLLVIDMRGRFHLIKHCWHAESLPTVAAVFAACPVAPWMRTTTTTTTATSATATNAAAGASPMRVDLKCAYRPDTATLYYGGLLYASASPSSSSLSSMTLVNEIHALSLAEEQVVQRLPVSGNAKLTCLAAHTTQRALLAGFTDGVVRYYDDRQHQGQLGTVGLMQCSERSSSGSAGVLRGVETVVGVGPLASLTAGSVVSSSGSSGSSGVATYAPSSSPSAAAATSFVTAAATRSALYIFDMRRLSEPLLRVSAADLYGGGPGAAAAAAANNSNNTTASTPAMRSHSATAGAPHASASTMHITNCVVGVHTGLVAVSFADGSYGAYNDRGALLHGRPLRASDAASSPPPRLPLPCSCAAHPLRPMMSFGGDVLALQL